MDKESLKRFDKIILGIDPGTNIMGHGVIGIRNNKPSLLHADVLNIKKMSDTYLKLAAIYECVQRLVEEFLPDEMAIEAPFYGKNIQSMLKLGRAQGVAIAAALSRQVPIREYEPRKVKLSITGNGGASKEQIREMLVRLLGVRQEQLTDYLDASDAIAIALCHFYECNKINTAGTIRNWKEFILKHPEKVKN